MATVSASAVTTINDLSGTPTLSTIGSGTGGGTNADIFIQGTQSAGRLADNKATDFGFWLDDGGNNDVSAAGTHVGMWAWVTQRSDLTALKLYLGTSTTNYDSHTLPLTEYPTTGGWVRIWVHVNRTPDATGGSGLTESQLRYLGLVCQIGDISGTGQNLVMDAWHSTTTGLSLTGTSGVWADFTAADENNSTGRWGVVQAASGVVFCKARLTLGTASSLVFNDSNFSVVFPQQALVQDTFMGVTIDLQNASTNIDWSAGVLSSPGTKKGDLIVTGTAGTFDAIGCSFNGLRIVTMTSKAVFDTCALNACGQITLASGVLTDCTINQSTASSALLVGAPGQIANVTGCSFISDGTGHAIEITGTAANFTLTDCNFSGYAAGNGSTGNEAIFVNIATGSIEITVSGGNTPSIRTAGATVTFATSSVTVKVTAKDAISGAAIENARVLIEKVSDGTDILTGATNASGVLSGSFSYSADTAIVGRVRRATEALGTLYKTADISGTITASGFEVTVLMQRD